VVQESRIRKGRDREDEKNGESHGLQDTGDRLIIVAYLEYTLEQSSSPLLSRFVSYFDIDRCVARSGSYILLRSRHATRASHSWYTYASGALVQKPNMYDEAWIYYTVFSQHLGHGTR
jgi:hypothetical protein